MGSYKGLKYHMRGCTYRLSGVKQICQSIRCHNPCFGVEIHEIDKLGKQYPGMGDSIGDEESKIFLKSTNNRTPGRFMSLIPSIILLRARIVEHF